MTDIGHYVGHDEWVAIGERLERVRSGETTEHEHGGQESGMTEVVRRGLNMVPEAGEGKPVWLRPAHDGLRLVVSKERVLEDGTYGA